MLIYRIIKYLALVLSAAALCSCFGGSIAQQVVSSLLLKGADKATAIALDVDSPKTQPAMQKTPYLALTAADRYSIAFLNSGFAPLALKVEPLPKPAAAEDMARENLEATKLVQVEVWNLLIGAEKQQVLEKATRLGMPGIPAEAEWQQWRVAIGGSAHDKQTITFLIPPDMAKIHSGAQAWVELATAGELNMARYMLP